MNIMPATTTTSTHPTNQQRPATHSRLPKQLSFSDAHKAQHNVIGGVGSDRLLAARKSGNGYLRRGLSVDRSLESIRQRLSTQKSTIAYENRNKHVQKPPKAGNERLNIIKGQKSIESNRLECVRTGSTTSIIKSLDYELKQVNSQLEQRYNCKSVSEPDEVKQNTSVVGAETVICKSKSPPPSSEHHPAEVTDSIPSEKSDCSKVNLNIVLSHAINFKPANSNESNNSDIESCSESAEPKLQIAPPTRNTVLNTDFPARANVPTAPVSVTTLSAKAVNNVQQRRAQFRSSRNFTINTSTTNGTSGVPVPNNLTTVNNQNDSILTSTSAQPTAAILNNAPPLIVQRRPPLVRAMSAPVRSRSLDENSKGILALQKRSKLRRRKLITRNASICEKNDAVGGGVGNGSSGGVRSASSGKSDILFDLNTISGKKQPITRTRSTLAVDVITLVSLVSSEGSDSEKEDSAPETGRGGNAERSRSTGAPSLRKTGKSVSFQENYPPNFQLATKEYSHMIRRGSIVPFAARLRSNRPPTAPPVPIFMTETNASNTMPTSTDETTKATNVNNETDANVVVLDDTQSPKDSTDLCCDDKEREEHNYPQYVRSLKERECWKLYRKMSIKGVSVSYETVLRGMLTPTEFRQLQKQREIEEAKLRALEEENESALEAPSPTSAMERLTQKLLKK